MGKLRVMLRHSGLTIGEFARIMQTGHATVKGWHDYGAVPNKEKQEVILKTLQEIIERQQK